MSNLSREQHEETQCWEVPDRSHAHRHAKARGKSAQNTVKSLDRIAHLTRTIESEIIPRLLLANTANSPSPEANPTHAKIMPRIVDELATAVVSHGMPQALKIIRRLQADGTPLQSIFLDVLAPAARQLGAGWDDDKLSFVDVTIGLARLQQLLRGLSPTFETLREQSTHGLRALLMAAKGEQHSFGLFMVESFFRRAGWDVVSAASLPLQSIVETVRHEWIDVIGISKSRDDLLDGLASDIKILRSFSRNKNITIMVGGAAFDGHPERVSQIGADLTAGDGEKAVWRAAQCVASKRAGQRACK